MARLRRALLVGLVFVVGLLLATALSRAPQSNAAPAIKGPGPPVRPGGGTTGTGATTTPPPSAPGSAVLRLGQSAIVQCGSGNIATPTAFTPNNVAVPVGHSISLPALGLAGSGGAALQWNFTRALMPGWPIPNTSDFGTLSVTGCTARYTAPASTGGNTPRMFVDVTVRGPMVLTRPTTTSSPGGESGPVGVPAPAILLITVQGSGGTPTGPCGYGTISVLASAGGDSTIVVDGRAVGTNVAVVRVAPGTHTVAVYLPDGSVRRYVGTVRDCQTWKVTLGG